MKKRRSQALINEHRLKVKTYTIKELQAFGLPLYYNERWLRGEVKRLKNEGKPIWIEIERLYGYPENSVMSYAKRHFGIDLQAEYDNKRSEAKKLFNKGLSQKDICSRLGLYKGTVHRYVRGK